MAIAVGSTIPDVEVRIMGGDGPESRQTSDLLGKGKVLLFGVPGAFTPGCSKVHLPGYVQNFDALKAKGVDVVACVAMNDAFVMQAWAEAQGASGKILMIADGNGDFARALGLDADLSGFGLGTRSRRFAAVIENGTITSLEVEEGPGISVSSCESMLALV